MMERRAFVANLAGIAAAGIIGRRLWAESPMWSGTPTPITVWKSSTCACCAKWVEHIEANGFKPTIYDEEEMEQVKDKLGVPTGVRSCHTARVDGYLLEGHVPASDIRRVMAERPKVAGLAVPEMPSHTPGMAPPGSEPGNFDVLTFQSDGSTRTFARH
jgi:hypothetical protein